MVKRDDDIRRFKEEVVSLKCRIASEGETYILKRRLEVCRDIVDMLSSEDMPDCGSYRDFNSIRPGTR